MMSSQTAPHSLLIDHHQKLWEHAMERAFNDQDDAAQAMADFSDKTCQKFDPAKGSFLTFAKNQIGWAVRDARARRCRRGRYFILTTAPSEMPEILTEPFRNAEEAEALQHMKIALHDCAKRTALSQIEEAALEGKYGESKKSDLEIATQLHTTEKTVKSRRYDALRKLKKCLQGKGFLKFEI